MDFEFWMWVAIVVISLIARARKSRKKRRQQTAPPPVPQQEGRKPPGQFDSFEELLREIEAAKSPLPEDKPVLEKKARTAPSSENPYRSIVDDRRTSDIKKTPLSEAQQPSEKDIRKKPHDEKRYFSYEDQDPYSHRDLGKITVERLSPEDEDADLLETVDAPSDSKNDLSASFDLWDDLHSRDGLKKAFILSEILRRKY